MIFTTINDQLRTKLGLWQGFRSEAEDQALYEQVFTELFQETLNFITENNQEIPVTADTPAASSPQEKLTRLIGYLAVIPDWEFRLTKRLTYYLNNYLLRHQLNQAYAHVA